MRAARLDCVPDGNSRAASKPNVAAARSCRRLTVGSSPNTSSPSSASIIARRIAAEGRVTVSERRSTIGDMRRSLNRLFVLLIAGTGWAHAQVEQVVTAKLERYSIAALVMHAEGAKTFRHGIALFPGHPGIMKVREEDGKPQFEMRGNFLVRSRRHWLDDE